MAKPPPKSSRLARLRRRSRVRGVWPTMWEAWPLVFLLLVGVYWGRASCSHVSEMPMKASASLVDRTPPKVPTWDKPPKGVEDVLKDLSRGDCWTASARLRGLRKSLEESRELRVLEGASFVCAGDGRAAANAVDPLLDVDFRGDALWVRANAALLMGTVVEAESYLELIIERDLDGRRDAEALLLRMSTL